MGKSLKLCTLIFGAALVFGCATQNSPENQTGPTVNEKQFQDNEQTVLKENDTKTTKRLVKKAKTAIGTPYVLGGTAPGGFDCSGLVKWAYNSVGVTLPRTAKEQSTVGQKIKNVSDMREGDIVAFRHPKRGYHTGIYVGDGKFVHSPRKRTRVRINSLTEPYFSSTLLGARRVLIGETSNVVAQAESRLEEYLFQRGKLTLDSKNVQAANDDQTVSSKIGAKSRASAKSSVKSRSKAVKSVKPVAKGKAGKAARTVAKGKAKNNVKTTAKAANAKKNATVAARDSKKSSKAISQKTTSKQGKNVKNVAQKTKQAQKLKNTRVTKSSAQLSVPQNKKKAMRRHS